MLSHVLRVVSGQVVIRFSYELDGSIGDFVFPGLRSCMSVFNFFCLTLWIGIVRHSMAERVIDSIVLWEHFM